MFTFYHIMLVATDSITMEMVDYEPTIKIAAHKISNTKSELSVYYIHLSFCYCVSIKSSIFIIF